MEFPKQIKDTVYRLLQEPTLDHFREFLQDQTGEHNAIDFKQEWIEKDKLAKLMLALANYGGGIVVFGVHENDDKTFSCDGLKELQAKEQIGAWIKPYLSSSLKYDVYDFSYQTSEYEALKGKQFQIFLKDGQDRQFYVLDNHFPIMQNFSRLIQLPCVRPVLRLWRYVCAEREVHPGTQRQSSEHFRLWSGIQCRYLEDGKDEYGDSWH